MISKLLFLYVNYNLVYQKKYILFILIDCYFAAFDVLQTVSSKLSVKINSRNRKATWVTKVEVKIPSKLGYLEMAAWAAIIVVKRRYKIRSFRWLFFVSAYCFQT